MKRSNRMLDLLLGSLHPKKAAGNPLPTEDGVHRGQITMRDDVWNPLRSFPANARCFCQSGLKFKKCCRDKCSPAMPKRVAESFKKHWDRIVAGKVKITIDDVPQEERQIINVHEEKFFE